jgi:hypothetical protein
MLSVLAGIAFIVVWLAAAAVWAMMSLMGGLMANDAGRVDPDRHLMLLIVLVVGEALVALAGVAGGSAFFVSSLRATLWWSFAGLLVVGAALQVWAAWSFLSAAS